ncbi:MAG: hypothetical protein K0S76_2824 [Herbinix sp.]|jgi:hypothetical protein|nr:hypothetical protein [Herbinix sp.]
MYYLTGLPLHELVVITYETIRKTDPPVLIRKITSF